MEPEIFETHRQMYALDPTPEKVADLKRDLQAVCAALPEGEWTKAVELLQQTEDLEKTTNERL